MDIKLTNNNGNAVLFLTGRLDTSVAAEAMKQIQDTLGKEQDIKQLTCDVRDLSYISSTGLRIILQLKKSYPTFKVIEVQPEVYNIFEMTGFTKMMSIEKALRQIDITGCEEIGRGGVGIVYRLTPDSIIKVFREGSTIEEVTKEISMAKEAFVLGMPTAISFDVVHVGEQYGLVYELLDAKTLSSCIKDHPEKLEEYAVKYAHLFRQLHSIEVPTGSTIPNAHENEAKAIAHISRYFSEEETAVMRQILNSIPQGHRLLHCDLQTKNVMLQGEEPMLIDMGEVGYGHPLLDLGHAKSAMVDLVGDYEAVIGFPRKYGEPFWNIFIHEYFKGETEEMIAHRNEQISAVARLRNFTWLSLSDSFPEAVIRECQTLCKKVVGSQKDNLLKVCRTFSDWE